MAKEYLARNSKSRLSEDHLQHLHAERKASLSCSPDPSSPLHQQLQNRKEHLGQAHEHSHAVEISAKSLDDLAQAHLDQAAAKAGGGWFKKDKKKKEKKTKEKKDKKDKKEKKRKGKEKHQEHENDDGDDHCVSGTGSKDGDLSAQLLATQDSEQDPSSGDSGGGFAHPLLQTIENEYQSIPDPSGGDHADVYLDVKPNKGTPGSSPQGLQSSKPKYDMYNPPLEELSGDVIKEQVSCGRETPFVEYGERSALLGSRSSAAELGLEENYTSRKCCTIL